MATTDAGTREADLAVIHRYLDGAGGSVPLEEQMELLAEHGRLELPYHPVPEARVLPDRAAVAARMVVARKLFRSITFHDVVIRGTDEPGTYVLEYRGEGETADGAPYAQQYCVIARLEHGLIVLWREYFNPAARDQAVGRSD